MEATVTIIGAGIAGLSAAKVLTSAGIDVVVLEAEDVPGGRMRTLHTKDDHVLELGAQWIHGEGSELFKFAHSHHLLSEKCSDEGPGRYLRSNGTEVHHDLVREVHEAITEILENCGSCLSIEDELQQQFEKRFGKNKARLELLAWHKRFQLIDNSCDNLKALSSRSWGLYEDCGTKHCINFKRGFSSIVDVLVKELPEGCLRLETPVRKIEWLPNVDASGETRCATVICDHMKVKTNHVIVTCSLGYLKEHKHDMFNPLLPSPLSKVGIQFYWKGFNVVMRCTSIRG